jgi:predicted P-loop ATPase
MLFNKKIWVNWKMENKGDGKFTKVPYQPNGKRASSTDPSTWSTHDEVLKVSDANTGIGIVFEPESGIVGVDLDHCIEDNKIILKAMEDFIEKANTYTEYSPSKTGIHILFHCPEQLHLIANKHTYDKEKKLAAEVYNNGRYFTFTSNVYKGKEQIRSINADEFESLLKILGYPWKVPEVKYNESPKTEITLDDEQVLQKMFNSKNGEKIKNIYNGDISAHNNDQSSADFALCLHLAFWTGKNETQMERIWTSSPLGQREKTKKRKDYREYTIQNACKNTSDIYSPKSFTVQEKKEEYIMSGGERPYPQLIMENICRVIENDTHLRGKFRLNDFSHMTETCWDKREWVNLYDGCIYEIQRYISTTYPFFSKVSKTMVTDAILSVAYRHKVNPPRDYFMSLVWDGKPRLNSWLHEVYGTPDDALHQAIGSNWIKGLVKRVMQPGCIFDEVIALESKQGWRKSTSIRELGKPWHVETTHSMDDKDFYILISQNIIVEFSEGEIFDRTSVKKIKAEVTKTEDQFRPPYERGSMKFKRSCVFAVTTNKLELKDETGNRRWLPVQLEKIADIDWIKENRDQLYAEAYQRVIINGETTHEYPEELEELQDSRTEWSDDDEKVLLWYSNLDQERKDNGITVSEVWAESLNTTQYTPKITKIDEIRISAILKKTLKLENVVKRVGGAVCRRWVGTEKTQNIINKIIN